MIKEPHLKVHYRMRIPTIRSWIVQVTPKDLIIKYHTEGSACRIENVRLDRLKSGLNMDKIEAVIWLDWWSHDFKGIKIVRKLDYDAKWTRFKPFLSLFCLFSR